MKVSDYIVEYLIRKNITDVFGYPGGMVTHLMESFRKYNDSIGAHVTYHEQSAAFAACGYAQATGKTGAAYATSGPGATNLITGICNAYFDSIPTIFITGQVNTFETKGDLHVRQLGFQETDIVSMVNGVTKYCAYVSSVDNIAYELDKAWYYANEGRKGPTLLDIPINIQRADVSPENLLRFNKAPVPSQDLTDKFTKLKSLLQDSQRPVLLIGAGIKTAGAEEKAKRLAEHWNIPVISSMPAIDVFGVHHPNYYGFIGAYGDRTANFIAAKSDLIISLGSRLDIRQVGARAENFAEKAKLVRVDIDRGEFSRKIKKDEIEILCDLNLFFDEILKEGLYTQTDQGWRAVCDTIKNKLSGLDESHPKELIRALSEKLPDGINVTADVGQNQVWIAQAFETKPQQKILFSSGHGAMGYALPAAIGAYYGNRNPVVCFSGDGGIQMNIQELQFVVRENIPVTIVILNNSSLGMIRHFQEMYFEKNYFQTSLEGGYSVPNFSKIANAYGIDYTIIHSVEDIKEYSWDKNHPHIIEMRLNEQTYVFPKLEYGKPNQDQEPLIDRELYNYLMSL